MTGKANGRQVNVFSFFEKNKKILNKFSKTVGELVEANKFK